MKHSVLIVEDEILVALDLKDTLEELGFAPVNVASDMPSARALGASVPEVAFVDVNLRDGPTGPDIGAFLADRGTTVMFLTANPRQVRSDGTGLGVLSKPVGREQVQAAARFAVACRSGLPATAPVGFIPFRSGTIAPR